MSVFFQYLSIFYKHTLWQYLKYLKSAVNNNENLRGPSTTIYINIGVIYNGGIKQHYSFISLYIIPFLQSCSQNV